MAAIESVSPSNKDRPETPADFVSQVAALLTYGSCVSIVEVVSTHEFNLYAQLMEWLEGSDSDLGVEPLSLYRVTLCTRPAEGVRLMDNWYHALETGQPLPTLPIWLTETRAVSLDLESSDEETCRTLWSR
ncbi:MAG: hypothetical protein NT069_00600 [Planctomycetota bacterium]|nr:hypothetical protein [Planctomycetota bacterium]